jgi:large subunit ribosomal protein L15
MANELSNLKPVPGSQKTRTRLGRGEGSGKGKTAGRGMKGQRARNTIRRGFEGGQMPLARRLPKRGFNNIFAKRFSVVRIDHIAARFEAGEVVDGESLKARGLINRIEKDGVKVLGNGEVGHALTVKAAKFTKTAAEKITAAGGTFEVV